MRIVQLVETLETGGLERIAVDLAMTQKKAGHTPILYCMFKGGPLADEARAAGVPVIEFHKQPGFSPKMLFMLARQLKRDRPDVLHTHNPAVHHYGAIAAWMAGVLEGKRGLASRKSAVIINGIELGSFLEGPAAPMSALPRIRFGAVGRMVPVKAHSILIDAFVELSGKLPNAELRIVGGGPLESDLKEQARKTGLNGRIRIEGLNRRVADVLRELDIFVLSSTSEGLPLVILEAMAAGLPVVSTRVGGVSEIAPEGEVSVLCAPGSASELAQAMYQAATACDLVRMGKRAREIAIAKFSLDHMGRSYEAIYAEALGRK